MENSKAKMSNSSKRRVKTLKRMIPQKMKNNFSTVPNIQVIAESETDTRPSQQSNTTDLFENDVCESNRIDQRSTNRDDLKKVKKRKLSTTGDSPEKSAKAVQQICNNVNKETVEKEILDEDEANIRDEDIDKFCDELDDADNEQYEAWVKLVEEKLSEKK
ncbi:uncharacterized protein LOC106134290 isoform X1 [Amyelois transitella]|uniref:uncharacterized protein LOC106134290 isoform X1 n=2 Tax=Amyelois transitella TaxID=680683 RepID=UPI00067B812C|nr:uncharacterized protein LOC106134290 isoform X1 [Amyelois transitella]